MFSLKELTSHSHESKTFVLDTNVLIEDPDCLFKFGEGNLVILTSIIIEELDNFKQEMSLRGFSSRKVLKMLESIGKQNWEKNWQLKLKYLFNGLNAHSNCILIPSGPDSNAVLIVADVVSKPGQRVDLMLKEFCSRSLDLLDPNNTATSLSLPESILVTRDVALRLLTKASHIPCEDYRNVKVDDIDIFNAQKHISRDFMSGQVDDDDFNQMGNEIYQAKTISDPTLKRFADHYDISPGEYFTMDVGVDISREVNIVLKRVSHNDFVRVDDRDAFGIRSRNPEQTMVMDAMLNPEVSLIAMSGQAGTGKTLITVACALELIINKQLYNRMIVARPVVSVGKDLGFLPGNLEEKLEPWMAPIRDALDVIFEPKDKKKGKHSQYENLQTFDWIECQSISHIRGRSIQNSILFIDEVQNATRHEIKTIISRAGKNTKVILCGDPWQIDNPHLDPYSNGLAHVINRLKNSNEDIDPKMFAHINLKAGERSPLAQLAASIL